jgi:hypothetical protein
MYKRGKVMFFILGKIFGGKQKECTYEDGHADNFVDYDQYSDFDVLSHGQGDFEVIRTAEEEIEIDESSATDNEEGK